MLKKRILIPILCLGSLLLPGCASKSFEAFETISSDNISHIQVSIGEQYKSITEDKDIEKIISNLSSLYLEENNSRDKRGYSIQVQIFNHSGNLIESIELIGNNVAVDNQWYVTDISGIQFFEKEYLKMDYEVNIDNRKKEQIDWKIKQRDRVDLTDALKGTWVLDNRDRIIFDGNYLYQDGYKFKYRIESVKDRTLYVSVFKSESTLDEEGKLFDITIQMDETKTNAKFEKKITPVLRYKYNMVYVDSENDKLGSFDSVFFKEGE